MEKSTSVLYVFPLECCSERDHHLHIIFCVTFAIPAYLNWLIKIASKSLYNIETLSNKLSPSQTNKQTNSILCKHSLVMLLKIKVLAIYSPTTFRKE